MAQPANLSDAEDALPPIERLERGISVIEVRVYEPAPAPSVSLNYPEPPKPAASPAPPASAKPAAPTASAPAAGPASADSKPADTPSSQDLGPFSITCYSTQGSTASGAPTGPGVAAGDSAIFPFGTKVKIEGVGTYTILDRGTHVRGNTLDIWIAEYGDCLAFGRQTHDVTVVS